MAFLTKKHLSRRTFLNGMGVTMALPFLESMVPAGTPLAQTAALAAVVSNVMVEPTAKRAEAMISKERMLFSRTCFD